MNISKTPSQILLILMLLPVQFIFAEEGYLYKKNITQNENQQQFELSNSQIRSRVEHRIVNFLLGKTIDQYLEFGNEAITGTKNNQQLKLRLNEHHVFLVYRRSFR